MISNINRNTPIQSIAVVGEVLVDHFPDGRTVLGGSPFNVAWNLQGLGFQPTFISARGRDPDGNRVAQEMHDWGLSEFGMQEKSDAPTGSVTVRFRGAEPDYEIAAHQAYDDIDFQELLENPTVSLGEFRFLYFGSLAFREPANRNFLQRLKQAASNVRIFVDLNIRKPWFSPAIMPCVIGGATWLKLNVHELAEITHTAVDPTCKTSVGRSIDQFRLHADYPTPDQYLITCGEVGAYWFIKDRSYFAPALKCDSMVDTVGAGDAFSAAVIAGVAQKRSPEAILKSAVDFAARVCSLPGAVVADRDFYARYQPVSRVPAG